MDIRPANGGDLAALSALHEKLYSELNSFGFPFTLNRQALEEILQTQLKSKLHGVFVADCGGKTAGFITCGLSKTERKLNSVAAPIIGIIFDLYVDTEYRSMGLASRLTAEAEHWLCDNGAAIVQLSVVYRNEPAYAFWAKRGYSDLSRTMYKRLGESDHSERT